VAVLHYANFAFLFCGSYSLLPYTTLPSLTSCHKYAIMLSLLIEAQ